MSTQNGEVNTATKTRKPRTTGVLLVECQIEGEKGWRTCAADGAEKIPTTLAAEKWIRENGKDGTTYRIIREVFVVTVKLETVRKVHLEAR